MQKRAVLVIQTHLKGLGLFQGAVDGAGIARAGSGCA